VKRAPKRPPLTYRIQRAAEPGLGVNATDQIEIVTGDRESEAYAAGIRNILAKG
jgi:hypothetical protein